MELIFWIGAAIVAIVLSFLVGVGLAALEEKHGKKKTYLICGLSFFFGIGLMIISLLL